MQTDRSTFANAVKLAARAADKRPTIPILGHVRLEAAKGTLTVAASLSVYPARDFGAALGYVADAASEDDTRPHLCGVLFADDGTIVATDGHRLHRWTGWPALAASALIPLRAIGLLGHALDATGHTGTLLARRGTAGVAFRAAGKGLRVDVRTSPTGAEFPPWTAVIPAADTLDTSAEVDADALRATLDAAIQIVPDKKYACGVAVKVNGALNVSADNPDLGTFAQDVPCKHDGPDVRVGLNAHKLAAALGSGHGTAVLRFGRELDPVRVEDPAQPARLAIVMPLRI